MLVMFLLLLALVSLANGQDGNKNYKPLSYQSGPDSTGSTYAASVWFDQADNTIIVTGSTYGTAFLSGNENMTPTPGETIYGCFMATIDLSSSAKQPLQWKSKRTFFTTNVSQGCVNMYQRADRLLLLGHGERGTVLDQFFDSGQTVPTVQFGTIMDLEQQPDGAYELLGGAVTQQATVINPVGIASSPSDPYVYMVSMATDDTTRTTEHGAMQLDPAQYFFYGIDHSYMIVTRLLWNTKRPTAGQLVRTLTAPTRHFYQAQGDAVYVAGILKMSDSLLVVAGHTIGTGAGFGTTAHPGSVDGFVTKLNPVGTLFSGNSSTYRIASTGNHDEWVTGICAHSNDTQSDSDHVYVVGATTGRLDVPEQPSSGPQNDLYYQAYLMKIQLSTLEMVWVKQVGLDQSQFPEAKVKGLACSVTLDGTVVWFAGTVEDSLVIPNAGTTSSYGGMDVFVAKVLTQNGQMEFIRQFGSSADDEIAMRGGLTTDMDGNAIVVGNTFGGIYRQRGANDTNADVFVATVSRYNGDLVAPIGKALVPVTLAPTAAPILDVPQPIPSAPSPPAAAPTAPSSAASPTSVAASAHTNNNKNHGAASWIAILFIIITFAVFAAMAVYYYDLHTHHEATTDRDKVLCYLNNFDVEDVDLKHSATGGWHCSYANDLAKGKVRRAGSSSASGNGMLDQVGRSSALDPLVTESLAGRSILKDSLFMEDDDHTSGGHSGGSSSRGGYDDLIDAYNDRSRESRTKKKRKSSRKSSLTGESWGKDIV